MGANTIERLCWHYNPDGGVCDFKEAIRTKVRFLQRTETLFPQAQTDETLQEKLEKQLEQTPTLAHQSEMSKKLFCNARGFAGAVTIQVVTQQQTCDCYLNETPPERLQTFP